MFLLEGLLSAGRGSAVTVLAGATFAIGLAVGATIGPVTASRGEQTNAPIAPARTSAIRTAYSAEVLRVIDGDTFEARINLWPGLATTTRVRLRGIDAPELKARCNAERVKAEAAQDQLRSILDQGEVGISRVTLDKYGGRVLADASTQATADVAAALLDGGLVRRYGGGHRDGWCD